MPAVPTSCVSRVTRLEVNELVRTCVWGTNGAHPSVCALYNINIGRGNRFAGKTIVAHRSSGKGLRNNDGPRRATGLAPLSTRGVVNNNNKNNSDIFTRIIQRARTRVRKTGRVPTRTHRRTRKGQLLLVVPTYGYTHYARVRTCGPRSMPEAPL